MCNACAFSCCGSDEFSRCGCDGCFEPKCWDEADDLDFDDSDLGDGLDTEDDDGGVLMPLAACECAVNRRFRCEAVA
jgi:hypothetical protein